MNLVALLAGAGFAQAQTPPAPAPVPIVPAPAPQEVSVSTKLDIVSWADTIRELRVRAGGKDIVCTAEAFEYSKPISYSGSNILEFRLTPQVSPTGKSNSGAPVSSSDPKVPLTELEKRRKKDPSIVALALLPTGSNRATVLMAPATAGTFNTFVIDDDPSKLPPGKLRIHNYCNFPIAVRCNRKEVSELKPKATAIVQTVDNGVIYELSYWNEGKWIMQENNIIRVEPTEQVQLVVLKSDAGFFASSDGSRGGFVQTVTLRRNKL